MNSDIRRMAGLGGARSIALAATLVLAVSSSQAIAPALLLMIKQVAKQAATSMLKDAVLSGLDGMGCKGMALRNALEAFDLRRAAGAGIAGFAAPPGAMGLPNMPNMPNMAGMPNMPQIPGMPVLPAGMGLPPGAAMPPEMMTRLQAMMPDAGQLPPGVASNPDAMAMMARMQQAMAQPLSPPETLATIDELAELGFLPKAMQTELKECMVLVPSASAALGMGMGMLKPVIPQLQRAREELRALPPAEQDEVAAALAQELRTLPSDQRAALIEHIESGFFPPRVSAGVKAHLAAPPPQ